MDRILKLVYDNWPLANGIYPALVQDIKQKFNGISNYEIQETIGNSSFPFRDHGNFFRYFKKHFPLYSTVGADSILNDGSIYWYPIEIKTTLDTVYNNHTVTVNGTTFQYSLIDTMDPRTLAAMRSGQVKIVINYAHDPVNDMGLLNRIETYFTDAGIPGSSVYIIPGDNCVLEYKTQFPDGQIVISATLLLMCQQLATDILTFPRVTTMGYTSDIVRKQNLDSTRIRPKRFLCFNRSMRPHRYVMAYIALKLNLLENSTFSFLNETGQSPESISRIISEFGFSDGSDYCDKIHQLIPYELDTQHLTQDERMGFNVANNKQSWFSDSYIHITSETRFQVGDTPFLSEKTWKPISNLHPFLMVGNIHTLRYLQELGFKTFSPFIDESYDDEIDYVLRMQKIYREIDRLNNMPINQLHDWYHSITDVLVHNQELLISMSTINPYSESLTYLKGIQ